MQGCISGGEDTDVESRPFLFFQELAFGAMPVSAWIIRYSHLSTGVALFNMTSKNGGSAQFNGTHCFQLLHRQLSTVIHPVCSPVPDEYILHLNTVLLPGSTVIFMQDIMNSCWLNPAGCWYLAGQLFWHAGTSWSSPDNGVLKVVEYGVSRRHFQAGELRSCAGGCAPRPALLYLLFPCWF